MNEREYRGDRELKNDQSSPGPITEYEREMYGGGDPQYNDHGSQFSLEYLLEENAEFYRRFGGEPEEESKNSVDKSALETSETLSDSVPSEQHLKNLDKNDFQDSGLEQLAQLGVEPENITSEDEQLLAQFHFDWNEALNVSPERARLILRGGNIAGIVAGFANDLLQYALDEADSAPWGSPLAPDSVLEQVKIAPPRDFSSDSSLAQAVVESEQFQEGMRDEFLPDIENMASSLVAGEPKTKEVEGQDLSLNYRDGRGNLQTPQLSLALGFANISDYTIKVEVWRNTDDNSVQYQAEIVGVAEDIYDFNNPTDEAVREDAFARPTRLAFIAQEGGTLAQYRLSIDLEKTLEGTLEI
jgi:hypothetical protein